MPRLLLFAPCEKVALDQLNNPILISILQQWSALGQNEPIPENAIALSRWDIFALWYRLPDDGDKEFVQTCELKTPSGQLAFAADIRFRMTATTHRNTITVAGLPVHPGDYELALYLSETGTEKDRDLRSTYPLTVRPLSSSS